MGCDPVSKDSNHDANSVTFRRRNFLWWSILGILAVGPIAKGVLYFFNRTRTNKLVLFPPFAEIRYAMSKPVWSKSDADNIQLKMPNSAAGCQKGSMGGCEFVSLVVRKDENNVRIMLSFKERQRKKPKKYRIEMVEYDSLQKILASETTTVIPQTESSVCSLDGRDVYVSSTKTLIAAMPNDILNSIDHILIVTEETPL